MRLKNQKYGPVTLRKIDYAANMSQETMAFTGAIKIDRVGEASIRNDGHGGPNYTQNRSVEDALEAFAKTLPPIVDPMFPKPLDMNGDLFVSMLLSRALMQKGGLPAACDECGTKDWFDLNERKDLPPVKRGKKLWYQCICDLCNERMPHVEKRAG